VDVERSNVIVCPFGLVRVFCGRWMRVGMLVVILIKVVVCTLDARDLGLEQ